jgi:hypothetical protein
MAMRRMLAMRETFLEETSAMCPKTMAPTGRITNPMAKTPQ